MIGEETPLISSSYDDPSNVGVIPRALCHLFDRLRQQQVEFSMRVSYLELYNEELCDLLSTDDNIKIRIYDDVAKKGSVIVQGLEEIPVRCKNDVYKLLAKGQERRKTAATLMNAQSSRSHTIFTILVHIKETNPDGEEMLKIGKLNLVDLAGSENISKAGNEKGIRTRESVNINQSLLTLGRVITALVERAPHVPYRESKLTRLLQESLGGRTKTSIIATISCGHKDLEETLSTLDYAHRAKNIQNKPEINQRLTKKVILKEYTEEIDRLKRDLIAAREKNGIYLATDTYEEMQLKLESQQTELNEISLNLKATKEELGRKSTLFNECKTNLDNVSEQLVNVQGKYQISEIELKKTKRSLRKTERNYSEAKHLIVCHQETEQKLTEHANDIMKIADEASKDTMYLQENINRRKDKDTRASLLTDKLIEKVNRNINDMRTRMEELKKTHCNMTDVLESDLDEYFTCEKSFTAKFHEYIKEQKDLRDDSNLKMLEKLSEWRKNVENGNEKNFEGIFRFIEEVIHTEEKNSTYNEEMMNDLLSMLAEKREIEAKLENSFTQKIESQESKFSEFCEIIELNFNKILKEIGEISESIKTKSNAQSEKLKEMKRIFTEMEELEEEDTKTLKRMSDVFIEISETLPIAKKFKSDNIKLVENCKLEIANNEKNRKEKDRNIENHTQKMISCSKLHNDTIQAKCKAQTSEVKAFQVTTKNELMSINDTLIDHSELTLATQQENSDKLSNLIKQSASNTTIKVQQVKSLVKQTLHPFVCDIVTQLNDNFNTINSDVEEYQSEDVFNYKPTGETPAKKDYKYNKQLSTTSPHERIIRKFRLDQGLSDSLLHDSSLIEVRNFKSFLIKSINFHIYSFLGG